MKRYFLFFILLASLISLNILFKGSDFYVKIQGDSNGDFFYTNSKNLVFVRKWDELSFEVGQFPLRRDNSDYFSHPIVYIIKRNDRVVGYITRGIKNEINDPILLPRDIRGRVFRVFEDGSIEKDTRYTFK